MSEDKRTIQDLQQLQALPLNLKVALTKQRIRAWIHEYGEDGVYVSFSGGKDSTVLLDIVRQDYPNVPAVFCNTGLELPEVIAFVKTKENVIWLRPKKTFREIVEEYGYPLFGKELAEVVNTARKYLTRIEDQTKISQTDRQTEPRGFRCYKRLMGIDLWAEDGKYSQFSQVRWKFLAKAPFDVSSTCCYFMKKSIAHKFQKETGRCCMTAQMASESRLRTMQWLQNGCNAFNVTNPISNPMSFWTESDVLLYIKEHNLTMASVYGDIVDESDEISGQMNLGELGLFELERPYLKTTGMNRTGCFACLFGFQQERKIEDNRLYNISKFSNPKLVDYMLRGGEFRESDGLWHPHQGLGYWFLIEYCNKYGNMKMTYPNREYYIEKYSTPETDKYLKGDET